MIQAMTSGTTQILFSNYLDFIPRVTNEFLSIRNLTGKIQKDKPVAA
jgi:hypothetical protein